MLFLQNQDYCDIPHKVITYNEMRLGALTINGEYGLDSEHYINIDNTIDRLIFDEGCNGLVLEINSPGGHTAGLYNLCKKIIELDVFTVAVGNGVVCSAAYYIAAPCDKIYSVDPTT